MSAYKRWAPCLLAGAAASLLMVATVAAQESPSEEEDTEEPSTDPLPEDTADDQTPEDEPELPPTDQEQPEQMPTEPPQQKPEGNAGFEYEDLCSDTKPALYKGDCKTLQDGYRPYTPKFSLWADGEKKERFVRLPGDVNASDANHWVFPAGTVFYKTFMSTAGQRFETRIIKKGSGGDWSFATWGWKSDGSAQSEIIDNDRKNWQSTGHNIPTDKNCLECHRAANAAPLEPILGFTAIQLNHQGTVINDDGNEVDASPSETLSSLSLSNLEATAKIPGDEIAQKALGYMNANCAHCHGGANPAAFSLDLSIPIGLTKVEDSPAWKTAVCQDLETFFPPRAPANMTKRIDKDQQQQLGAVVWRMNRRDDPNAVPKQNTQMPRLATTKVHAAGVRMVSSWVETLDACTPPTAP